MEKTHKDTAEVPRIVDAASIVLVRKTADGPAVLMGQRGKAAAFMPSKFVFPGGAVDPEDFDQVSDGLATPTTLGLLQKHAGTGLGSALLTACARELSEETGLTFSNPQGALALRWFFRAVTPPGRPRRFDARFFLAKAKLIHEDLSDFSRASGELAHLQWVTLSAAAGLDLPFVTQVVLAEARSILETDTPEGRVPFFDNRSETPAFSWLER